MSSLNKKSTFGKMNEEKLVGVDCNQGHVPLSISQINQRIRPGLRINPTQQVLSIDGSYQ